MAFPLITALGVAKQLAYGALLALNLYNELNEALEDDERGEPVRIPPPYTGGQCEKWYQVQWSSRFTTQFSPFLIQRSGTRRLFGKLGNTYSNVGATDGATVGIFAENGRAFDLDSIGNNSPLTAQVTIISVTAEDGLDNCGNLAGDNVGNPENGLYRNDNDNFNFTAIAAGAAAAAALAAAAAATAAAKGATAAAAAALVAAKGAAAAAAAAVAGASSIGGLAASLSAVLSALLDLLLAIKDLKEKEEEEKEKEEEEKEKKKELPKEFISIFGIFRKDGYLALYPDNSQDKVAIELNTTLRSLPSGIGRYFGELSPNRFIYNSIGYIAFTSARLGVIKVVEIEFPRHSIPIPERATGFFFHFGLLGVIRHEISVIYRESKEEEE